MTDYITGGVRVKGKDYGSIPTKKRLKEMLKTAPHLVEFVCTSDFHDFTGPVSEMPSAAILQITGPNPVVTRSWYANVRKTTDGFRIS